MKRKQARFERVRQRYDEQVAAGHVTAAEVLLRQLLALAPNWAAGWFDLGLLAKLRGDWPACRDANERALALGDGKPGDPAAWNLGIAATALGDAEAARWAWIAYGVDLPHGVESLGPARIRLNPAPRRPGQRALLVDGAEHRPEIVWADRLGPAHAVVTTVPTPGSGHRYGDVVLHDGEQSGAPDAVGVPMFDELARLEPGPHPTTAVTVTSPGEAGLAALLGALAEAGLPAEDWTTSVREVCGDCADVRPEFLNERSVGNSGGPPSARPVEHPGEFLNERSVGIAGPPGRAAEALDRWAAAGGGRSWRPAVTDESAG
jgi:hypothetical protein